MPSWDDEEQEGSRPSSPTVAFVARPPQFDDEEEGEEDIIDDWENDDSDAEREKEAKVKAAAEAEAEREKAAAEAKAAKGSRVDRMKLNTIKHQQEKAIANEDGSEDEQLDRAEIIRREREADLAHADDLFGDLGEEAKPKQAKKATIVSLAPRATGPAPGPESKTAASASTSGQPASGSDSLDLANLALFSPKTKADFAALLAVVGPLLSNGSAKKEYVGFVQDLSKEICRTMNSEQVRKVVSSLTALSNEKMKEEKGPAKKSKASKTKVTLNSGGRNPTGATAKIKDDTYAEDDGDDDYFM